ncbi:SafA/ExsA family spore coat assembly protein, partial [Bacillus sp. ISL-75]|nr:SafA/ExsA family spore coat assembly protein [Bacillus sp. ISL-75]
MRVKIHIVQKGDTLWKIAKKYGVNFEELKKMNSQLSNPDMIMPGMKIKVPTSGGTIKKEAPMGTKPGTTINLGVKKEMPLAEQPLVKEKPVKEVPIKEAPIAKEAPIKEAPIKEAPIKEAPIKEAPIKEAPIKEAPIIKEAPKAPYTPKMPLQIVPEIDINNYYMMNMQNMTVQQPPKPANILPEIKEVPKKEVPIKEVPIKEVPIKETPIKENIVYAPPPVMEAPVEVAPQQDYCVPVTPVMPGPGFCPPFGVGFPMQMNPNPFMPYPQMQGGGMPMPMSYPQMHDGGMSMPMPYQQMQDGGMPMPMPYHQQMQDGGLSMPMQPSGYPGNAPSVAGASFVAPQFDDESSSFMPQLPVMNPAYNPSAVMGAQSPQQPIGYPSMAPAGHGQMPQGYGQQMPAGYGQMPQGYGQQMPGGY